MPVDPAAIPRLSPEFWKSLAVPVEGIACPLVPEALSVEEQRLLLVAQLGMTRGTHVSPDFEYTLKKTLQLLGEILEIDFVGFVDLDGVTVYGLALNPCPASWITEFSTRARGFYHWLDSWGEPPVVIWNRRAMTLDDPGEAGTWFPLQSWVLGQLRGFYLLHFKGEPPVSRPALRALAMECDLGLNSAYLLRQHDWSAADMAARLSAVKEMLGLFRDVTNPNFCLEYLLILLECCRADRGALWEIAPDGTALRHWSVGLPDAIVRDLAPDGQAPLYQQALALDRPKFLEGAELLVSAGNVNSNAIVAQQVQSCRNLLLFPLVGTSGPVGAIALLDIDSEELLRDRFVEMISNVGATYLEAAGRHQELLASKDLEHQLKIAEEIQMALLPSQLMTVEGYDVAAVSAPAQTIGGDFFHFHRDGHTLQLTIGDVSGKGIPAALLMTKTEGLFDAYCNAGVEPSAMLELINNSLLVRTPSDRFVTAFHCRLDARTGELECWNAGHDPLLILRAATGKLEAMNPEGMILGVVPDIHFTSCRTVLEPGDVALLFTDGLPESMDAHRHLFGDTRVERTLRRVSHKPAQGILDALLSAVHDFAAGTPQYDDTTVIVLRAEPIPIALPIAYAQESHT